MNNINKITEGNAFAINIRQAVWRTLGGVIQPLQASELVDVHLYVGSGSSKSTATEYMVTADGDTISAVMPATLKRGVYRTWLTAIYNGREVASNCDAAFEIVAFDEHYQAYAPERVDAPMAVYLQPADVTDAELEQLKAEYRAKNAALDAAKAEAEQARKDYIAKAEALESAASREDIAALAALVAKEDTAESIKQDTAMLADEQVGLSAIKRAIDGNKVADLIGTPAEGQADTLFAAINASPVGIIADVENGKKSISDAIVYRGGESSPTDSFSSIADSVRNLPLDEIAIQGTWKNGIYPKNDIETIFNFRKQLTKIDNNTVQYIDSDVFSDNGIIEEVKLKKLTTINVSNCFIRCSILRNVDMPLLEYSRGNTFNGCKSLLSVNFPSLKNVDGYGFLALCDSLHTAILPRLEALHTSFFEKSYSLVNVIANSVVRIEDKAFIGCKSLVRVETSALLFDNPIGSESTKINYFSVGRDIGVNINLVSLGSSNDWNTNVDADEWNANFREGIIDRIADLSDLPTSKTITLGQYAFAKLTEETIALANAKGWNIAQG